MHVYLKVAAVLGAVGLAIYAFAPNLLLGALPLLFLAACPLSMVLMMKMMMPGKAQEQPEEDDQLTELRAEVGRLRAEQATEDAAGGRWSPEVRP